MWACCDDYDRDENNEKLLLTNKKPSNYEVIELTSDFSYCDADNSLSNGNRDIHFIISFN